jgi:hypothetical protein
MKKHLWLVCGALAEITILHFGAFAETAKPNATAAPPCCHLRTTKNKRTKLEENCDRLRR